MSSVSGQYFPPSERVLYGKPPIIHVACEVRFPPVLRIEAESPAMFQERIRGMFPLFERRGSPFFPAGVPIEIIQAMQSNTGGAGFQFQTEDKLMTVVLTAESLALAVTSYHRWEKFRDQFDKILLPLMEIYRPSYFTRVGLRYQDLIMRSDLGLNDSPWSNLLRSEILGELNIRVFEENLLDAKRVVLIKAPSDGTTILLQHGLAKKNGTEEVGYMIDLDFSATHRTEISDVRPKLDELHEWVGRAFRWCISDKLHYALEPTPIPDDTTK